MTLQEQQEFEGLTFAAYQEAAEWTATYPSNRAIEYLVIGLLGEAGELANKYKKVIRGDYELDDIRQELADESLDCVWYISELLRQLGFDFGAMAQANLDKLADRKSRGKIKGSGDNR